MTLRRLGEIALRIKYLEVLCQRSISATLHGGDLPLPRPASPRPCGVRSGRIWPPWPLTCSAPAAPMPPWANYRLTSRSLTIAGGTTQINKNITAQRVLGLPRK